MAAVFEAPLSTIFKHKSDCITYAILISSGSIDPDMGDFQIVTRTVTFTGAQEIACTDIPITDDDKDEPPEEFEVDLETPSNVNEGNPNVATVTIFDDDGMRMQGFIRRGGDWTSKIFSFF